MGIDVAASAFPAGSAATNVSTVHNTFRLFAFRFVISATPLRAHGPATIPRVMSSDSFQFTNELQRNLSSIGGLPLGDARQFRGGHQRHRGPGGRRNRDPLVVTMRETALEIRLETEGSRPHVPGTVRVMGSHQVINAAPVRRTADRTWVRLSQGG